MAIIEDDFDHEVQFVGRPVLPLASADEARAVIYVGTLSKVLAPGIRVGYVAAQAPVIDAMRRLRWYVDRSAGAPPEASLLSVPRFVYRMVMLAWSLWLALALIRWLKWGFAAFAAHGFYRPFEWRPWRWWRRSA